MKNGFNALIFLLATSAAYATTEPNVTCSGNGTYGGYQVQMVENFGSSFNQVNIKACITMCVITQGSVIGTPVINKLASGKNFIL